MTQHTPGPWRWFGNGSSYIYLATTHSGRRIIMDFVRKGMRHAQPRFQPPGGLMVKSENLLQFEVGDQSIVGMEAAKKDGSVYRFDIRGIDNADARLIAAAPELLEACKAAMSVLSGEVHDKIEPSAPAGAAMDLIAAAIRKASL